MDGILTWTQTYLSGGTAFAPTTQPTLAQVEQMIDERVAEVTVLLTQNGYAVAQPVATVGTAVATVLSRSVIMGALIDIEMTKQNRTLGRDETARWQLCERRFTDLTKLFEGPALEQMGATRDRDASAGLKATGASWDEQEAIDADEDRKGATFPRGFLDPNARKPSIVEITDPANQ